jgi:CheY-like chemotaxis protein
MRLRYVDGQPPQDVADALAISRRQYYRVHDEAIRALAEVLLARQPPQPAQMEEAATPNRLDLLRAERERHTQGSQSALLAPVMDSALSLLADRLAQHRVRASLALSNDLLPLKADPKLLRQLLLGVTDFLVERARDAELRITAQAEDDALRIEMRIDPAANMRRAALSEDEQLTACEEMAALNNAQLATLVTGDVMYGFVLRASTDAARSQVLVVDDNADTLELYRRYLAPHGYDVVAARNSREAFDALERAQPIAIFLDLMLPEQDGWDILQTLQSRPDTRALPVFICSVLMQKELALSLGAAGFLHKPFTQATLLAALTSLKASST